MTTVTRRSMRGTLLFAGLSVLVFVFSGDTSAQQKLPQGYITGTVTSANGPEAGVWVIAETSELPTHFIKIVVTDDRGRYMVPELPTATYDVWVRGYGLADSARVKAKPAAAALALKAVVAKTPQEAAKVYPSNYWYSLIEVPAKSEFPGTGPQGNGISANMKSQAQWVDVMKQGCQVCHQLGNQLTRSLTHLQPMAFKTSVDAWDYRTQTGQRSFEMKSTMDRFGRQRGLKMFADWTDHIAAGEVPPQPPRPKGVERNVVLTLWDWGKENSFIHDEVTTAKANPRVNAGGKVYAASAGHGDIVMIDPLENKAIELKIPTRLPSSEMPTRFPLAMPKPSNFWGETLLWGQGDDKADPHNPMMDVQGRLWLTSTIRGRQNPDWCKQGSANKFAQYFPLNTSGRQVSFYDPNTGKFTLIDTCFGTHHLQFGEDENRMLYFSGGGPVIPWVNTKAFDQTHNEQTSQGWCPTVIDTNGDGKITKPWNEPVGGGSAQEEGGGGGRLGKFDPALDTRVQYGSYGIVVSPLDGSLWASSTDYPGHLIRFSQGSNPPETCISEMYTVAGGDQHFGPRGIDVDRHGVIWTALSGSAHFASFDRTKCKVRNGPTAVDGMQCPEGWKFYDADGPNLKGTDIKADYYYYNWVDQFNTFGLGENTPIATGSGSDQMLALNPTSGEWVHLRVPYPLGFYSRGVDGRIDDAGAGWKGRGLWATYGTNFVWHIEGGKGTKSKMVHFQLRPDPMAR